MFAALVDAFPGARVEHWRAHDGSREVGRIKPDPAGWVSIDILKPNCLLEAEQPRKRK